LAATARKLAARICETGTARDRVARIHKAVLPRTAPPGFVDQLPERASGGVLNPTAVPLAVHWDGTSVVSAEVVIDEVFAGGLGRVHGGVVASMFDDVLSHVVTVLGIPAVTSRLAIAYRSPTPTGVPVRIEGTLTEQTNRRIVITGEIRQGETVTATAEQTMVIVDADRFSRHQ
jgi:acyl-coenzyme A thioesterase PaaI-like protein